MAEEEVKERNQRKVLSATVVSNKMDKTLVVKVAHSAAHPLYRKVVKITSKCYVHDEIFDAQRPKMFHDFLLQGETAVVGSDRKHIDSPPKMNYSLINSGSRFR